MIHLLLKMRLQRTWERQLTRLQVICFQKWQFMIPSGEEQDKIGAYFKQLDHLITLHQRELDHLQLLKKGMLQQMFI